VCDYCTTYTYVQVVVQKPKIPMKILPQCGGGKLNTYSYFRYSCAKKLYAVIPIENYKGNITDAHFHSRWQNSCFVSLAVYVGTYLYIYTRLIAHNPQGGTDRRKKWILHKRDLHPAEGNAMLYSCGVSGRDLWTFCNDGDDGGLDDDLRINTYWA
jgi:hypothetical protein